MKEETFLWFFGPSAVGKETAVKAVASDPDHPLRKHLRLSSPVSVVTASLTTDGRRSAAAILTEITKLRETTATFLIKGQRSDFGNERLPPWPVCLRDELPHARHEIVLLWTSVQELTRRATLKHNWPDQGRARAELAEQLAVVPTWGLPVSSARPEEDELVVSEPPASV